MNLLCIVLLTMICTSICQHITIISSDKLEINDEKIDINIATFGNIPYGHVLNGDIIYDFSNKENDYACRPLNNVKKLNKSSNGLFYKSNSKFLMLDRGNCTFVTKARNAQLAGASLLIINNNTSEDIKEIYMIDDGSGHDIEIPTILISKKDGDKIKKLINPNSKNNKSTSFKINFPLEKQNKVTFETVMSSSNFDVYSLLTKLEEPLLNLSRGKFMYYPVYFTQTHPLYDYNNKKEQSFEHCYSNGKYCFFPDTEAELLNIDNGRVVLKENLRQICVYKARQEERNPRLFFNYIKLFYDKCIGNKYEYILNNFNSIKSYNSNSNTKVYRFNDECSNEVMEEIMSKDKVEEIKQCILDSFGGAEESKWDTTENALFNVEKKFKDLIGVDIYPSLIVNKRLIYVRKKLYNLLI